MGQLVRGIRFGDRPCVHRHLRIDPCCAPIRLPCRSASSTIVVWPRSGLHLLSLPSPASHMACQQLDPRVHGSVYSGQQLQSLQHSWVLLGDSPCMRACVQIDGTVVPPFDISRAKRHGDSSICATTPRGFERFDGPTMIRTPNLGS